MVLELSKWLFINLMVALGLGTAAAHPRLFPGIRNTPRYPWRDVLAFTVMAVFSYLVTWSPEPGIKLDLRNVVIGLVGWTHGFTVAAPVAVIAAAVRLFIGGAGVEPAIWTALFALVLGSIFHRLPRTLFWVAAISILQSVNLMVSFQWFMDYVPQWARPTSLIWAVIALLYGVSYYMLSYAYDVAPEVARLRDALASELKSREALLELIPYAILVLDRARRPTPLNQAARNVLAGTELLQRILTHPEICAAMENGSRIAGCRITYSGPAGEEVVVVTAVPLHPGAVLGIENVTTLVEQERNAAHQERLQLLGQLAAMAAHEIKNPLTTIKGFLQLMDRRAEFAPHRPSFALVQGEVEHINQVVNDFLVLANQGPKRPAPVEVDVLLQETAEGMLLHRPGGGIELSMEGESGLRVMADAKALTLVLRNLLLNAVEAMPAGGRLQIIRGMLGSSLRISVVDSGPGIPPEVLPLIFRPFMTTKETGTGLGLAIAQKLTTEMGGKLEVASEVGRGSRFTLTVPVSEAAVSLPQSTGQR